MQEPSWWCQRHRQCATERCSRRGKRDEQCWQSLDNLGETPHDRRVGAGQCLSCVEEQFSSSTLDQPKTCAVCVSDVEQRGALSCSARVDGVYELLLHGTGVARELFVSVRFLFLPGIWAYVVHRRESGSPVWYRTYSKKKNL